MALMPMFWGRADMVGEGLRMFGGLKKRNDTTQAKEIEG